MTERFGQGVVAGLVLSYVLLWLMAFAASHAVCHESIDAGQCDAGGVVSIEGEHAICRCPSPGGTITIAKPGGTP